MFQTRCNAQTNVVPPEPVQHGMHGNAVAVKRRHTLQAYTCKCCDVKGTLQVIGVHTVHVPNRTR